MHSDPNSTYLPISLHWLSDLDNPLQKQILKKNTKTKPSKQTNTQRQKSLVVEAVMWPIESIYLYLQMIIVRSRWSA